MPSGCASRHKLWFVLLIGSTSDSARESEHEQSSTAIDNSLLASAIPTTSMVVSTPKPKAKIKTAKSKKKPSSTNVGLPMVWSVDKDNSYAGAEPVFSGQRRVKSSITSTEPIDIFSFFFDDSLLELITYNTNLYAAQENRPSNITKGELLIYLGINVAMTYIRYPRARMYWSSDQGLRCSLIADAMPVNRFETITKNLHFTDNLSHNKEDTDKVWKLRPVLDYLATRFKEGVTPEESHSVDEMMVPFTGRSSLKQYIRSKPKPWGFKIWTRSGVSGYVYAFEVYQGANGGRPDSVLGLCADVVVRLCEGLEGQNHKVYFDNLFTTLPLLLHLKEMQIFAIGTLRKNRLAGAEDVLLPNKQLKERGTMSYATNSDNITIMKWNDNNIVHTASTFVGKEPLGMVKRWDKKAKDHIEVPRPRSIEVYNKHMGGVDLTDFLIACYRHTFKHKRWYLRLFFHLLNMSIVNSWLILRFLKGDSNQMDLLEFRGSIARALINNGTQLLTKKKRGPVPASSYQAPKRAKVTVPDEVRFNTKAPHWPIKSELKHCSRCALPKCSGKSKYLCKACNKALCVECFEAWHTK